MEYILIPTKTKSETAFFLDLLKKMHKEVATISEEELENVTFTKLMKQAETSGKGSLSKVKGHLIKVASGK